MLARERFFKGMAGENLLAETRDMCMMSQRQTNIFNPFSFCFLEYAGTQGRVAVAFPLISPSTR